jgi:hypothetical protein
MHVQAYSQHLQLLKTIVPALQLTNIHADISHKASADNGRSLLMFESQISVHQPVRLLESLRNISSIMPIVVLVHDDIYQPLPYRSWNCRVRGCNDAAV